LASNKIGEIVGWRAGSAREARKFYHSDGGHQQKKPGEMGKPEGLIALANVLPDMRALSVTNVMGNKIGKAQLAKLQEIMRSKPNLVSLCGITDDATEASLSRLGMDADDASILASELPDKGALSSANLLGNDIGIEQASALAVILKEHPTLKSLCGNKGDETELDMSGKNMLAEGAIMLVPEIIDNGALTKIDLSRNNIPSDQEGRLQRICEAGGTELAI